MRGSKGEVKREGVGEWIEEDEVKVEERKRGREEERRREGENERRRGREEERKVCEGEWSRMEGV